MEKMNPRTVGCSLWLIVGALAGGATMAAGAGATFDSGTVAAGGTYMWHSTEAGSVAYHCKIHPAMTGTITVQAGDGMGKTTEVKIQGSKFVPAEITILAGSDVTWTNMDSVSHTVTSDEDAMMKDPEDAVDKGGDSPGVGVPLALLTLVGLSFAARRRV